MEWEYFNPTKLIVGENCVQKNAALLKRLGGSCLIVTGKTSAKASGALGDMIAALDSQGIAYTLFDGVEPNPTLAASKTAGDMARENGLEFVVGIGGGSPIDAAKAAAVYAANEIALMDIYNLPWKNPALPVIAVGTTAGTGTEVGPAAVMTTPEGRKKSLAPPELFPIIAFGDARYTHTLPLRFTVSTALDSLAHAIEGYFSLAANEITDIFAIEAISVLVPQLRLLKSGLGAVGPLERERLYYASLAAGMVLARCGTTYCHTLGYLLTERYNVPHGFACALTLPDAIRRGGRFAPDKAERLYRQALTNEAELCELTEKLCERPDIKIPGEVLAEHCRVGAESKNFARTLPNGIGEGEAFALMQKLFG